MALTRLGFAALPTFDSGFFSNPPIPLQVDYLSESWRIVATGADVFSAVSVAAVETWRRILNSP